MLMLKPPCELGPLAIEIELFDSMKSSSFIFITSNEYGLFGCFTRFARLRYISADTARSVTTYVITQF